MTALITITAHDPPAASNLARPPSPRDPPLAVLCILALVLLLALAARVVSDAPESVAPLLGPASEAPMFTLDAGVSATAR